MLMMVPLCDSWNLLASLFVEKLLTKLPILVFPKVAAGVAFTLAGCQNGPASSNVIISTEKRRPLGKLLLFNRVLPFLRVVGSLRWDLGIVLLHYNWLNLLSIKYYVLIYNISVQHAAYWVLTQLYVKDSTIIVLIDTINQENESRRFRDWFVRSDQSLEDQPTVLFTPTSPTLIS